MTSGVPAPMPSDCLRADAASGAAPSTIEPGAFSITIVCARGSMARTVSSRAGQMTMTTRERRIMKRSISKNIRFIQRERLNAKFESCCGRLECMS